MLRELTPDDQQTILDFAYQREIENMFVIGSFEFSPNPFEFNTYLGYFENDTLIGLGTYFGLWSDIQINAQSRSVINAFVDEFIQRKLPVKYVIAIKRYALPTIERLKTHGREPEKITAQTLRLLKQDRFHDQSTGAETRATHQEIDHIIRLEHLVEENEADKEITEVERTRIFPDYEWLLHKEGQLISKANLHGISKNFAQIGGVMTHPAHQGKGHARQIVSAISRHWLDQGKQVTLVVSNENTTAIKVYDALGFQPVEEFIHAQYS
ncbi:MAG: hypothetical protein CME31_16435 [Gimesia sp.]|mgnify:CR=1 FL=1|jgi:predicted GNAT family acetyltransferase|uniref:N-acetyltransferase domain-containing protein n=1 Tax=Gimesia maris TaxID=122 RepID=A0A3D3RE48_9PLAN|nr:hypothetical protein [Gimesia sp.]HCO27109.1 hypothetical protein [Gimesia maris]|tara:strand:+ start:46759 stop:47562 length:804 start_codon:yes stop_codon:yes gene_type:complete